MADYSDILLTVDYDRTLTGPDSRIPRRNIEAIEYFIANGGAFTVNTGRSLPMARAILEQVPLSAPLLLYNGSAAYDPSRGFTRTYPIGLEPDGFVTHLQELFPDLVVETQGIDGHYSAKADRDWEIFSENGRCPWGHALPSGIPGPFLKASLYGSCAGHTMPSMYEATPEETARMREAVALVEALYGEYVDVFLACIKIVDIHAKGVSKIRAARDLQKDMGRRILVCVGDGENDLSMLEGADYAFSPADSIMAERFPAVCPCGEGAVADVIYKKIPGILKNGIDKME